MSLPWHPILKAHILLGLFSITCSVNAQYPTNPDALRALIRTAPHDTTKAQAMLFLAVALFDTEPDSSLQLSQAALTAIGNMVKPGPAGLVLKPIEKKALNRIKATAQFNVAQHCRTRGDAIAAIKQYEIAKDQFIRADFEPGIRDAFLAIGELHAEAGNMDQARYFIKRANLNYANASDRPYGSTGYLPDNTKGARARPYGSTGSQQVNSKENVAKVEMRDPDPGGQDTPPKEPSTSHPENRSGPPEPESPGVQELEEEVSTNHATVPQPKILYSTVSSGSVGPSAHGLRVDSSNIAKFRNRLSKPVSKIGGEQAAREHFEMGEALELIREPALAEASFRRSLVAFSTLRSDSGECIALLRIGKVRGEQSEFEAAFSALDSARTKARAIGRRDLEGIALAAMGDMCRRIEECGGATKLYRRSIELAHATGDKRTEARGYIGMTEELLGTGSFAEAEPVGIKGMSVATEANDPDLKQQGALLLRGVYAKLGRLQEADSMENIAKQNEVLLAAMDLETETYINELRNTFAQTTRALETALDGERVKARKNWKAAVIIAACALLAIAGGALYYRSDRRIRQARAERHSTELEIKALRSQMNPHFLFNALYSIQEHIQENEAEVAAGYLAKFSKLMRQVLEMSRLNEVPLQRELDVLGMYVELERMRLKNRFSYEVDISSDVDPEAVTIPPMLLQPFVENAVWHGLARKDGHGLLRLSVARADTALRVTVEDDGVGRQTTTTKGNGHTSLGTSITKERLELWSAQRGVTAHFTYLPMPVGTCVVLLLPWDEI